MLASKKKMDTPCVQVVQVDTPGCTGWSSYIIHILTIGNIVCAWIEQGSKLTVFKV